MTSLGFVVKHRQGTRLQPNALRRHVTSRVNDCKDHGLEEEHGCNVPTFKLLLCGQGCPGANVGVLPKDLASPSNGESQIRQAARTLPAR